MGARSSQKIAHPTGRQARRASAIAPRARGSSANLKTRTRAGVAREDVGQGRGQILIQSASFKWSDDAGGDEHARSLAQVDLAQSGGNEKGRKKHNKRGCRRGRGRGRGKQESGSRESQNRECGIPGEEESTTSTHSTSPLGRTTDCPHGGRQGHGHTGRIKEGRGPSQLECPLPCISPEGEDHREAHNRTAASVTIHCEV